MNHFSWRSIACLLVASSASILATPRQPGEQVGLFWLAVSNPNATSLQFDFKAANMTNMLFPGVPAAFTVSAQAFTYRPEFTIPSTRPELNPATVVPESLGGIFAGAQTIGAGNYDFTLMSLTSVDPAHVADLIGQLNSDISTRNLLIGQFGAEAQQAMWTIVSGISPIPLDWESVLSKLLEIWVPGSDATLTLIDLGVTEAAMQNTLQSLSVLQPQMDQLATLAEAKAMDVWLPYGTAVLSGSIPDNPDPGVAGYLALGPKGTVPTGNNTGIYTTPDDVPTVCLLAAVGIVVLVHSRRDGAKRRGMIR